MARPFTSPPVHTLSDDDIDQLAQAATDTPEETELLRQHLLDARNQQRQGQNVPTTLDSPSGIPNIAGMLGGMIDSYQGGKDARSIETQLTQQARDRATAKSQLYDAVRGKPDRAAFAAAATGDRNLAGYAKYQADQEAANERDLTESANRAEDVAFRQRQAASEDARSARADARMSRRDTLDAAWHADEVAGRRTVAQDIADQKAQAKRDKAETAYQGAAASIDNLGDAIDTLKNHPGLAGITGKRGMIYNVPGSAAADAAAQLHTIQSQIMLSTLAGMRAASATGSSGMGALSNQEGEVLKNSIAALNTSQSYEAFQANLDKVKRQIEATKARLRANIDGAGIAPAGGTGNTVQYDASGQRVGG